MRVRCLISVVVAVFFGTALAAQLSIAAASDCVALHYDSAAVALTGKAFKRTFAGPPNYQSIQQGDRLETVWVLSLAQPVCVSALVADSENETANHIKTLQLVFMDSLQYKQLRRLSSKQMVVTGRLLSAQSGHHHTRVLLEVAGVRAAAVRKRRSP